MASRKNRKQIAQETVAILESGTYRLPDQTEISIAEQLDFAKSHTKVYTPEELDEVVKQTATHNRDFNTEWIVENCTTFAGCRALLETDPEDDVLCLNFASAKNPGGGFLNGSQAQEESLSRASGLYACIAPMCDYYDANRACGTAFYTHHMIYSPKVPVFRDDEDRLIDQPWLTSMITAPAVNAGAVSRNEPKRRAKIASKMLERIKRVFAVALLHGHESLVLGAWGCGVFKNDPVEVAEWFHYHLGKGGDFYRAFRRVHFAVLDRTKNLDNYQAFARHFAID